MSREDAAARLSTPLASAVRSHTSTEQWQSFEMRMRYRRAERCALRAEVALEAGFSDEAREALDEARRLDSSIADFDTLQARIAARREALSRDHQAHRTRRTRRLSVAAAVLLTISGTAGWLIARNTGPDFGVHRFWVQASAPSTGAAQAPNPEPRVPTPESRVASPESQVRPEYSVLIAEAEVPSPASPTAQVVSTAGFTNQEPATPNPGSGSATLEPGPLNLERQEALLPLPGAEVPAPTAPPAAVARLPEPVRPLTAASAAPPSPPPVVDEGPRVRAALARYEAAYSALSVSATQEVWPGVNARSLARAFEGLESQRLSLGQCALAIDGASARADCNGTATWTPRIGGGTRTEPRNWRFELQNASGQWQIVRAEAR